MTETETKFLLDRVRIKATPKKAAVLNEITSSREPIDAYGIHKWVASRIPMDLATVYRAIALFREKCIVREDADVSGTNYYEYSGSQEDLHPHFRCEKCEKLTCLPSLKERDIEVFHKSAPHYRIKDISVSLSGICKECLEE